MLPKASGHEAASWRAGPTPAHHRIVDERVVVLQGEAPMPSWARVVQTANWAIPVACSDQMGKLSA